MAALYIAQPVVLGNSDAHVHRVSLIGETEALL